MAYAMGCNLSPLRGFFGSQFLHLRTGSPKSAIIAESGDAASRVSAIAGIGRQEPGAKA